MEARGRGGQETLANLRANRGLGSVFTFCSTCGTLAFVARDKKTGLTFVAPENLCALMTQAQAVLGAGQHDSVLETQGSAGPGPALSPKFCGERNVCKSL